MISYKCERCKCHFIYTNPATKPCSCGGVLKENMASYKCNRCGLVIIDSNPYREETCTCGGTLVYDIPPPQNQRTTLPAPAPPREYALYFYRSQNRDPGKWIKCYDEGHCMQMARIGYEVKKVVKEK